MVELIKIMVSSFKRSHAHTAALIDPNPAAGDRRSMPPLETPGHSRASLGQSLVESLLLSSRSWCAQGFVCAFQESVSPVLYSGGSIVEVMVTSFKMSHVLTAILSACNLAAGYCQAMPPLETPGHSQASMGQSAVGSLLHSPRSW